MLLLLKYNKVTNQAIDNLILYLESNNLPYKAADLAQFGKRIDLVDFRTISLFLKSLLPFNSILIGDIFWPTGQNICAWCKYNNVTCGFLQHGQWIYTVNKTNPTYSPDYIFVYGNRVVRLSLDWPLAKKSKIVATGNPRYDNVVPNASGEYVYFSPPVMCETLHNRTLKYYPLVSTWISPLEGIDKELPVVLQPHYREADTSFLKTTFPSAKFVDPADDPFVYIRDATKVLTHRNSTVVLDAIAHGKIAISMNYCGSSFYPPGFFGQFMIEPASSEECRKHLVSELALEIDASYAEKASEYIYLGNASQRIAKILYNAA